MLKAILEFFARFFGTKTNDTGATTDTDPQDGADMPDDSEEVVVSDSPPVVVDDAGDDAAPGVDDPVFDQPDPTPTHVAKYLWCLDNGHGEATPGKRSPAFEDGSRLFEFELVRDINARIMNRLDQIGVKYFNVVPETAGDISLTERVNRANAKPSNLPKIYLSIHANAFGSGDWSAANGIETWYYETSSNGKRIASAFQKHLIQQTQWTDRGIRFHTPKTRAFFVLRKTSMAAALTENGFYTNRVEAERLQTDAFRQRIADAHVDAILEIEQKGIEGISIYPKNIGIKLS